MTMNADVIESGLPVDDRIAVLRKHLRHYQEQGFAATVRKIALEAQEPRGQKEAAEQKQALTELRSLETNCSLSAVRLQEAIAFLEKEAENGTDPG